MSQNNVQDDMKRFMKTNISLILGRHTDMMIFIYVDLTLVTKHILDAQISNFRTHFVIQ